MLHNETSHRRPISLPTNAVPTATASGRETGHVGTVVVPARTSSPARWELDSTDVFDAHFLVEEIDSSRLR